MELENNVITYEAIFEMLRREKGSDALQKLDESYFSKIIEYVKGKSSGEDREIFNNARKLIKEIYERREKKIMTLAVDKCRLGMESVNTANMLNEERVLFTQALEILQKGRAGIIDRILSGNLPAFEQSVSGTVSNSANAPASSSENVSKDDVKSVSENLMVRFLHAVPRFVGKELEVYGPFEQEEIANVPNEIAKILIAKGRAEEIKT